MTLFLMNKCLSYNKQTNRLSPQKLFLHGSMASCGSIISLSASFPERGQTTYRLPTGRGQTKNWTVEEWVKTKGIENHQETQSAAKLPTGCQQTVQTTNQTVEEWVKIKGIENREETTVAGIIHQLATALQYNLFWLMLMLEIASSRRGSAPAKNSQVIRMRLKNASSGSEIQCPPNMPYIIKLS